MSTAGPLNGSKYHVVSKMNIRATVPRATSLYIHDSRADNVKLHSLNVKELLLANPVVVMLLVFNTKNSVSPLTLHSSIYLRVSRRSSREAGAAH